MKLPTYPWQRRRFWYEEPARTPSPSYLGGQVEHPLLGYRLPEVAQLPDHHIWQNSLAKLSEAAHRLAKEASTPEGLYKEMALAEVKIIFGEKNHVMRRLTLHKPLIQNQEAEGAVQTSLNQQDETAALRFFYRPDDESAWELLAEAELQIGKVNLDWLYELRWETSNLTPPQDLSSAPEGLWLIFADRSGVGQQLSAKLMESGVKSRLFFLENETSDFDQILSRVEHNLPIHVVYLWGLDLPLNALEQAQAGGAETLISLTQALSHQPWEQSPGLWIVTQGAQSVIAEEPQLQCAALWGLGRVIALEQPELWRAMIDLPLDGSQESRATLLFNEIFHPSVDDQVVYRDLQRYVPRLIPAQNTTAVLAPVQKVADGAYLITGGLGLLGNELGHWLVRQGARHLVLTSRSGLPERAEWDLIPATSLSGQRIANVRSLEQAGAQVHVVRADVADEQAMQQLMDQFGKSLPPLKGLIHAAGTTTNQTVAEMDLNTWQDVLQPKIKGAWLLHRLTANISLDFFICFSSAASVWGSQGMAAYAAAKSFFGSAGSLSTGPGDAGTDS